LRIGHTALAVVVANYAERREKDIRKFLSTDYADYTDFVEVVVEGGDELVGIEKYGLMKLDLWEGVGRAKALYFRVVANPRHKCRG